MDIETLAKCLPGDVNGAMRDECDSCEMALDCVDDRMGNPVVYRLYLCPSCRKQLEEFMALFLGYPAIIEKGEEN